LLSHGDCGAIFCLYQSKWSSISNYVAMRVNVFAKLARLVPSEIFETYMRNMPSYKKFDSFIHSFARSFILFACSNLFHVWSWQAAWKYPDEKVRKDGCIWRFRHLFYCYYFRRAVLPTRMGSCQVPNFWEITLFLKYFKICIICIFIQFCIISIFLAALIK